MSDTSNEPAAAAVDALKVAEDTLTIAREAELQKEAAVSRAKAAETKLVVLEKVAAAHEKAVDNIVAFLSQEGYLAEENQEKFASEFKSNPGIGVDLFKRIVTLSASSYEEGEGIPKSATEIDTNDMEAAERALWEKVANEGA